MNRATLMPVVNLTQKKQKQREEKEINVAKRELRRTQKDKRQGQKIAVHEAAR